MPKKILIADDDAASRSLVARAVEREGYSAILASDGIRARTILDDNSDIALMITDIVMPTIHHDAGHCGQR
jgi:CheY-like chemotaxis protein